MVSKRSSCSRREREREREMGSSSIPGVTLNSGHQMPVLGMGTASYPIPEAGEIKQAIHNAINLGYRHFDTASLYRNEELLGEAIKEALHLNLIESRDELFITSKLWCDDGHQDCVIPALQKTLRNLQLDYLDLYLIHWPVTIARGGKRFPPNPNEILQMDYKPVWEAMEECQKLGLTISIGVSNFSCKKLDIILSSATILPSVNQVEVNALWRQEKLIKFCKAKGITVTAYSPLGTAGSSFQGNSGVMECEILKEIAKARGKTQAQVCLRWVYEQGVSLLAKSFNHVRMKENLDIFDWELTEEDRMKIADLPQSKGYPGNDFISVDGPYKSLDDLWDVEI